MTSDMKRACKQIIAHYGDRVQRHILIEECAELTQAVIKCERGCEGADDNFVEELADVTIMIEQMVQSLCLYDVQRYNEMLKKKISRQLERMQLESTS
jgi:NTP pyrophosphatase (non-canonical NTP hydrolase)